MLSASSAVLFLRSFTTRFQSSLNSLKFRSSATCRLDAVFSGSIQLLFCSPRRWQGRILWSGDPEKSGDRLQSTTQEMTRNTPKNGVLGSRPGKLPTNSVQTSVRPNVQTRLDGDTVLVSIRFMTEITSKELHEQTGSVLDSVKRGQRFRVLRNGTADALLVPANEEIDPSWDEIMADVRKARAKGGPTRPNPILAERRKRNYAARLRR